VFSGKLPSMDGEIDNHMTSQYPTGSVQGLCTAGATCFAVCSAFLGYWGFQQQEEWHPIHFLVLLPLALGSLAFIVTPFLATAAREKPERFARTIFAVGAILTWFAICAAVILSMQGVARPA
jgi:hypothetical protein